MILSMGFNTDSFKAAAAPPLKIDGQIFAPAGGLSRVAFDKYHNSFIASREWIDSDPGPHYQALLAEIKNDLPPELQQATAGNRQDLLSHVNKLVNQKIKSMEDRDQFGQDDYWQTPEELSARRQGDCEDYSILKKKVLTDLGVRSDDMFLMYTRVNERGASIAHMVLMVKDQDGQSHVLDSRNSPDILLSRQDFRDTKGTEIKFLVGDDGVYTDPNLPKSKLPTTSPTPIVLAAAP